MMTFEQLVVFVAVAEQQHLTRAAQDLNLTPSAVSSALRKLEGYYGVQLFDRVGRGLTITTEGRLFLDEARATLTRMRAAEGFLAELGGLHRGALTVAASQTIAGYWLPDVLMRLNARHPGIDLSLSIGNTETVARAVASGTAEIGYIEGALDNPALRKRAVADDALMIVTAPHHLLAPGHPLAASHMPAQTVPVHAADLVEKTAWVLRERGSGTRSAFEDAMAAAGVERGALDVVMELPSNEAVLSAVRGGGVATAVSSIVAGPWIAAGALVAVNFSLPSRSFELLTHKERHLSKAAEKLIALSMSTDE